MSEPWVKWLQILYVRVGGAIALSNIELEELQAADLASILADITALQTLTTSHTASIASTNTDLDALANDIENRGNFR